MKEYLYHLPELELNYAEGPKNGPPFLLLHGGSSRWQSFEIIIPDLIKKWQVYAVDLRGHGKSSQVPRDALTLQDHAQDIASFIQHRIKNPTIVFGHSFGGQIGIMTAAYYPKWVRALIVGDSPLSLEVIYNYFNNRETISELWREWKLIFKEYKIEILLPMIKCPTLILRGNTEKDSLIRDIDIEKALKLLPKAQQRQILHVGHSLFIQDKNIVLKSISDFLKSFSIK
jgi:pimeloyl-ACP methyl ester carboxylesterase